MTASAWTLFPGRARVPDAAAPDVRGRSYTITARVRVAPGDSGALVAHGDRHAGYALHLRDGFLVHDYAHAGTRTTTVAATGVPTGRWLDVGVQVRRTGLGGELTLRVDGTAAATGTLPALARARTGYTGLDLGCDRGIPVGRYAAPHRFTGALAQVHVVAEADQWLDADALWEIEGATG